MLTVRTNAALGRLAALQRRADRIVNSSTPVIKPALKELSEALEELQVANEQLHQQLEELMGARQETQRLQGRFRELLEALPIACIWTTSEGAIDDANPAAAALLNVSAGHLTGRPLALFMLDRQKFLEALGVLNDGATGTVAISAILRPRERRSRNIQLLGRKLQRADQYCWFLQEPSADSRVNGVASSSLLATQE